MISLIEVVKISTANNDSLAQLKDRVKTLGKTAIKTVTEIVSLLP
jgi:hypothetical protein